MGLRIVIQVLNVRHDVVPNVSSCRMQFKSFTKIKAACMYGSLDILLPHINMAPLKANLEQKGCLYCRGRCVVAPRLAKKFHRNHSMPV